MAMSKVQLFLRFLYENQIITKGAFIQFSNSLNEYLQLEDLLTDLLDTGEIAEDTADIALEKFEREEFLVKEENLSESFLEKQFHRYILLDEVGVGGMAKVYKALDPQLNRQVALKTLKIVDENQRFLAEANAIAKLHHPNIINIYDVGKYNGFCYYTMEYIKGKTLNEVLREGIDFFVGVEIFRKIVEAVQYIHQNDIIHRDLKPDNILLKEDNAPIIVDFGLVKNLVDSTKKSHSGIIVGTPSYMSPEQAQGKIVGPASDIFSLGIVLYEMLTGINPFFDENIPQTLMKVSFYDPPNPRSIYSQIDVDLETICLKCLEKQAVNRYSSAQELANDIKRFQNKELIHARPANIWRKSFKFLQKNKLLVGATLTSVAVIVTILLSYILILRHFTQQQLLEIRAANIQLAKIAKEKADRAYEKMLWREVGAYSGVCLEYIYKYNGSDVETLKNNAKQMVRLALENDSRLWSKKYAHPVYLDPKHNRLVHVDDGVKIYDLDSQNLILHEPQLKNVAFPLLSCDDRWIVKNRFVQNTSEAPYHIWDFKEKRSLVPINDDFFEVYEISSDGRFLSIRNKSSTKFFIYDLYTESVYFEDATFPIHFSPNNKFFVYLVGDQHEIAVYDFATKQYLYTLERHNHQVSDIIFTKDNKLLISGARDGEVRIWNLESGKYITSVKHHTVSKLALSNSEELLAIASEGGYISIWDLNYSFYHIKLIQEHKAQTFNALCFSKDDTFLYAQSSPENVVSCWRVFYKKQLFNIKAYPTNTTASICINHDETVIASTLYESSKIVKLWDIEKQKLLKEFSHPEMIIKFDFHAKHDLLLCASTTKIYLWDTKQQKLQQSLTYHGSNITTAIFSPLDPNLIVSTDIQGNIYFYNFITHEMHNQLPHQQQRIISLTFSEDGTQLACAGKDIFIWNIKNQKLLEHIPNQNFSNSTKEFSQLNFLSPNKLLVMNHRSVWLYNLTTKKVQFIYDHPYLRPCLVKNLNCVYGKEWLIDIPSGKVLQHLFTTWTNAFNPIITSQGKLVIVSGRGYIRGSQLPQKNRYHSPSLPKWSTQFPNSQKKQPHSSPFDFNPQIPGWFIEQALNESPQKLVEILFGVKVGKDLEIYK